MLQVYLIFSLVVGIYTNCLLLLRYHVFMRWADYDPGAMWLMSAFCAVFCSYGVIIIANEIIALYKRFVR